MIFWVTFLSLLFVLQMIKVIQKPAYIEFMITWILAFSAVLFKESGFVTLGLYFIILYLFKRSPFSGLFRYFTAFFIITFTFYLIYYALTRTFADRQLDIGIGTIINIWYFIGYMFFPISKRIADFLPSGLIQVAGFLRIVLTISIPILLFIIMKKGVPAVKFFLVWTIMYISTTAIMKWNLALFDLYPSDTAGRFFYTVDVGLSAIIAWLILYIYDKININLFSRKFLITVLAGLFILTNLGIVYTTSRIYSYRQTLVDNIINDLKPISRSFTDGDTLTILIEKKHNPPEILVESEPHIQAIMYLKFNKNIKVFVEEKPNFVSDMLSLDGSNKVIAWNTNREHFIIPVVNSNINL